MSTVLCNWILPWQLQVLLLLTKKQWDQLNQAFINLVPACAAMHFVKLFTYFYEISLVFIMGFIFPTKCEYICSVFAHSFLHINYCHFSMQMPTEMLSKCKQCSQQSSHTVNLLISIELIQNSYCNFHWKLIFSFTDRS